MNKVIILVVIFLFISCETKKYENDTDSFSEIPDTTEDTDIIDTDVKTEDKNDVDDEIPDEDYSDIPCGSVYLNGIDSYISVEHDDALNLGTTWTIEAWVMQDDINAQNPIIRKGGETNTPSYWIYGKSSDITDVFYNTPNGGFQFGEPLEESHWLKSRNDIGSMRWFHTALVKTESELLFYVNGTIQNLENSTEKTFDNDENLFFGARINGKPIYFTGLIDEIRLSSKARYSENFTPQKRFKTDDDTITVWHFDEDSGSETISEGAKILKGILKGSAQFVNNCNFKKTPCDNDCFIEGETRCSEGVLQTCRKNNNKCLEYINEACSSKVCGSNFICEEFVCLFEGMSECSGGKIRVCFEDDDGILKLTETAECNGGSCADVSTCLSKTSECEYINQTKCSNGKQSFCKKEEDIFIWSEEKECSLGECDTSSECKPYNWKRIASSALSCRINSLGELFCSTNEGHQEKVGSKTDWVDISSLDYSVNRHICAISGGELFCTGSNNFGQLGDGTTTNRESFVKIGSRTDWTDISTYFDRKTFDPATCGIAGGELLCWGANQSSSPQKVGDRNDWEVVGGNCSIASGKAYCRTSLLLQPQQIGTDENWDKISSAFNHACGIKDGELFCWGNNDYGKLGDGSTEDRETPVRIGTESDWTHIATGAHHTCGIASGKLFCWGNNQYLQLGIKFSPDSIVILEPTQIGQRTDWTDIDTVFFRSCGIAGNDSYCWGWTDIEVPEKHSFFSDFDQVSIGQYWICGIKESDLYCSTKVYESFISNAFNDPVKLSELSGWTSTSSGYDHACGIRNGELYCWGYNNSEQVGNGTFDDYIPLPEKISDKTNWKSVNAGKYYTCGIESGELYCWGKNNNGQLGVGSTSSKKYPIKVGTRADWDQVAAGEDHTCGIASGKLFCWGENTYGKLGNGSTDFTSEPVQVGTRTDWEQVVVDKYSSCGIASGKLLCWGTISQSFPYLHSPETEPLEIGLNDDHTDISLNYTSVCTLRKDKSLYCWYNENLAGESLNIFSEMVAEIKWKKIFSGREKCGITDDRDLICPLVFDEYNSLQELINP